MSTIPRSEYPRPSMIRPHWQCLNGPWQFEHDPGDSGIDRGLLTKIFDTTITVPFCPESSLSGIGKVDHLDCVWYRRDITVPADWKGQRILLHFQAVDHDATVWVNGVEVARHRGGWAPFTADITKQAAPGSTATVVVRARDDHRVRNPLGKQSSKMLNRGCHYTRTTGIWQTVWLEPVPASALQRPRITPDFAGSRFIIEQSLDNAKPGMQVRVTISAEGKVVGSDTRVCGFDGAAHLHVPLDPATARAWSIEDPFLYDVNIALLDAKGGVIDQVTSYAGLRGVAIDGQRVLINGKPVFQRLVLDQGYYPDGILTAPDEAALIRDIEISKAVGFNGARLHQKVFEERFLYHCDRMGYIVWGEFGDWAGNGDTHPGQNRWSLTYVQQWLECVARDYSHPSIVGWCPLNETHDRITDRIDQLHDITWAMYQATKLADRTRPVLDTSGYCHRVPMADIYDSHDYCQDPVQLAKNHEKTTDGVVFINDNNDTQSVPYAGQPYFVSEFGGAWWNAEDAAQAAGTNREESWGYGQRVRTVEEFYTRFDGLCSALLKNAGHFGYCYTQLTDVFQEQNGLFNFDRSDKFDNARLQAIQQQAAAIEATPTVVRPGAQQVKATKGH